MADLSIPFSLRDSPAQVDVSVRPNDDPAAVGSDLLDISAEPLPGFISCEATIATGARGYRAACGWIQLVRSSDASGEYEMDPLALFGGVETPFAFFGIAPTLFDAPTRDTRDDLVWTARSFLCTVPDAVVSKTVTPVLAFEWGFELRDGETRISDTGQVPLSVWAEHLSLLRQTYPTWTFMAS